ncbi:SecDF P1 head subdomain-containing protein [Rhizobium mulingense]|uniref:SecDF P1 head subdomain-containing protein n=1 Tax=Rhizobium mulingense TaxID=3031128 RepID=UPI002B4634D6|nr:hypothetical protein [Rhizobium sp. MJ21]MEB3042459.1 hypothetical protein [Rhizobium sp. MJ21]
MRTKIAAFIFSCSVSWAGLAIAETVQLQVASGEVVARSSQENRLRLTLTSDGSRNFSEFTARHVGKNIDVLIDHNIVLSSHLNDPVLFSGRQLQIEFPAKTSGAENMVAIEKLVSGKVILELRSGGSE